MNSLRKRLVAAALLNHALDNLYPINAAYAVSSDGDKVERIDVNGQQGPPLTAADIMALAKELGVSKLLGRGP